MPRERFKDVTIGGQDYRIELLPADVGNWAVGMISTGNTNEESVFLRVQTLLLNRCSIYRDVDGVKVPQMMYRDGKWLLANLEIAEDVIAMNDLVEAAMDFNFTPFFEEQKARRKKAAEAAASATTR